MTTPKAWVAFFKAKRDPHESSHNRESDTLRTGDWPVFALEKDDGAYGTRCIVIYGIRPDSLTR